MESSFTSENYSVEKGNWQDEPVYFLRDHHSGAEAMIVPGIGANCVTWSVQHAEQKIEILETPPDPEALRTRRFKAGIPILWPFPGRVREARYTFEGREHHLPVTDKAGVHHIHGLVISAPWQVNLMSIDAGASLRLRISSDELSEAERAGYPFNFALFVTYTLIGNELLLDARVDNLSNEQNIPFSYGLHPYFRAPLQVSEAAPDRSACPVLIPAAALWPTQDGLPTGPAQPLAPELDFREWKPLSSQPFDHMYSQVSYADDWTTAAFRDPGLKLEVRVKADEQYHDWVMFTQPNRPSLCLEPYTAPPNVINFEQEGLPESGLTILKPGQSWNSQVIFEIAGF